MSPQAGANAEPTPETPEKRRARLDGIRKLIQQASSPHGDGAQAAMRACALIRKFGLDLVDPELLDGLYKENHELRAQIAAMPEYREFTVKTGGGVRAWWTAGPTTTPPPTVPKPPPTPPPPPPAAHAPMTSPVFIAQSKFAGRCKQCRKIINMGDPVQWQKSVGVWCGGSTCYTDWFTGTTQAAHFSPFNVP